jgi:hypothetical protein
MHPRHPAYDPVLTAESVRIRLSVSAHRALTEQAEAGILGWAKEKARLVCWIADRQLTLVALTERSNRVGGGDTKDRKPGVGPTLPHVNKFGADGRPVPPDGSTGAVEVAERRSVGLSFG